MNRNAMASPDQLEVLHWRKYLEEDYEEELIDQAAEIIISYLDKYDRQRSMIFQGEDVPEVHETERTAIRCDLLNAHMSIAEICKARKEGYGDISPMWVETHIRKLLSVRPLVIEGGKQD